MGLLGKFFGDAPAKQPTDDILLLHAMMLMTSIDGVLEGAEVAVVEAFLRTLPEFKDADVAAQLATAKRLRATFTRPEDAIAALTEISSLAVRKKAFVLAADIAMSSGDIDDAEEELLEAMQHALGIDDAQANQIIEVLSLKYVR